MGGRSEITELLVVDQVVNGWPLSAQRARGIGLEIERGDFHAKRVEAEEPSYERIPFSEDQLDGLQGLNHSDESWEDS